MTTEVKKDSLKFKTVDYIDLPCELYYAEVHKTSMYRGSDTKTYKVNMVPKEEDSVTLQEIINDVITLAAREAEEAGVVVEKLAEASDLIQKFNKEGSKEYGIEYFSARMSSKEHTKKVPFCDKEGEPLYDFEENLGNGTKAVVSLAIVPRLIPASTNKYAPSPSVMTATLKFMGIQIVELVKYQKGSSGAFGKVEDFNGISLRRHGAKTVAPRESERAVASNENAKGAAKGKGLASKFGM